MAHPVLCPKKTFFYPIGNTPPVCLTQGLSPEKSAEILLLGCGDPRSILYTVYADLADGKRDLDITCCDWEPAVLARNILLLTMIADGVSTDTAWSIFYHLFLDENSHNILIAQCRTLIQASPDTKTWMGSKYGSFLRFCTEHSLAEIRRHWVLYAESKDLTKKERKALKASFHSEMKSVRESLGGTISNVRAAGPLFLSMIGKSHQSYTLFWTTGVTASKSSQGKSTPYVNPTFVYSLSGKKFNVHYGTDPIMAFHLAPALAIGKEGKPSASAAIEDLVDCAKSQFSAWCSSFWTRLSLGSAAKIVIRFFVGESLAFGQALHICKEQKTTETGVYAHPWGGPPIVLDTNDYNSSAATPSAPLSFNVIDTSNLADHTGLLNILVVTVPLLDRKPWSILHTSTLLRSDDVGPAQSPLSDSACADIPTLSMLLGVAPSPHLWHFTSHSNKHEIVMSNSTSRQLLEGISWRFVSSFIPNVAPKSHNTDLDRFVLLCDSEKLAQFFFSVYLRMFTTENQMLNFMNIGLANFHKQNAVHYVRESFVAFLALVKGSIRVDWEQTMDHLVDLIAFDRSLMMGLNNYQDLIFHMHLRGVHTLFAITSSYVEMVRSPRDRFHGWQDVPDIVCVVLKVPRHKLKCLEDMDANEIQTPMLQCEISGTSFHNVHSSIHLTFGDISVSVTNGEPQVTVKEDPKGWSGSSSLIVTFYIASRILCIAPTEAQIGLHIHSTPSASCLISRLGMFLALFSTSLSDTKHVQVVRHRPNNAQGIEHLRTTPGYSTSTASEPAREIMLKFDPSGGKATHLIIRKNITEPGAKSSLASGSKVFSTPIADSSMLVTFDDYAHRFNYPFPVQMNPLVTRIARTSSYIEIESPIRPDFHDCHDLSFNPFAVAYADTQVNLLNIHYLNLDILPALSLPGDEKDLQWVSVQAGMMYSEAEKKAKARPDQEQRGALVNLKESISCMLLQYAGLLRKTSGRWSSVFWLTNPRNGGIYTLIFVNSLKLDLASHTIVLDACVVPLVDKIMTKLSPAINALARQGNIKIITCADEERAWKQLLPVLAERCRTWKHTNTCEYRNRGVPASLEGSEHSSLCSCGKGKNLGEFGTLSEWKLFHEEATRIAIGPLFSFSFMEASQCAKCGGPGKPTLRVCSVCKKMQYCSRECQKVHWKVHKKVCARRNERDVPHQPSKIIYTLRESF